MFNYKVIKPFKVSTQDGHELLFQKDSIFESSSKLAYDEILEFSSPVNIYETYNPWWFADYGILDIWKMGYTGKGVKVAVLDSGIYLENGKPHEDMDIKIDNLFDATKYSAGMRDYSGHGVHISGIIKASNNGLGVTGIAYNCDFFFAKIRSDVDAYKCEYLINAINWAISKNVDVINISNGFSDSLEDLKSNKSALSNCIKDAIERNIVVVCASGNKSVMEYPAALPDVISIGAIKIDKSPRNIISNIVIYAPGDEINSTSANRSKSYEELSGTSQACAYMTGVVALMIEKYKKVKKDYTVSIIKNTLISNSTMHSNLLIANPLKTIRAV